MDTSTPHSILLLYIIIPANLERITILFFFIDTKVIFQGSVQLKKKHVV